MQPHELRVLEEKKELDSKLEKLNAFLSNPKFIGSLDEVDKALLQLQSGIMENYSKCLQLRINRFGGVK